MTSPRPEMVGRARRVFKEENETASAGDAVVWRLLHDQDTWCVKSVGVILKRIFSIGSEMGKDVRSPRAKNPGGASSGFKNPALSRQKRRSKTGHP